MNPLTVHDLVMMEKRASDTIRLHTGYRNNEMQLAEDVVQLTAEIRDLRGRLAAALEALHHDAKEIESITETKGRE